MIIGIGSDLCDIRRIEETLGKFGDRFVARCFTEVERRRSDRRAGFESDRSRISGFSVDENAQEARAGRERIREHRDGRRSVRRIAQAGDRGLQRLAESGIAYCFKERHQIGSGAVDHGFGTDARCMRILRRGERHGGRRARFF